MASGKIEQIVTQGQTIIQQNRPVGDGAALLATIGALLDFLPAFAAVLGIIWWGLNIYLKRLEISHAKKRMEQDTESHNRDMELARGKNSPDT